MNITKAQYMKGSLDTSNTSIKATIDSQEMTVPLDPANRHYAAILEWVKKGNKIEEAE